MKQMTTLLLSCINCQEDIYCEQLQRLYSHDYGQVTCKSCGTLQEWEIRIDMKK